MKVGKSVRRGKEADRDRGWGTRAGMERNGQNCSSDYSHVLHAVEFQGTPHSPLFRETGLSFLSYNGKE